MTEDAIEDFLYALLLALHWLFSSGQPGRMVAPVGSAALGLGWWQYAELCRRAILAAP